MYTKRLLFPVLAGTLLFASCADAPEADEAQTGDAQEVAATSGTVYSADLGLSNVNFTGASAMMTEKGSFALTEGSMTVDGDNITGGTFIIDINSVNASSQTGEYKEKFEGHLKSADFFDTENHPTATFEITNVTAGVEQTEDLVMKDATHNVTGNLNLKGVSKSITFPAKLTMTDDAVTADASFNIDRTDWGMHYHSDESIKDEFINKIVNLKLHLVANAPM